MKKRRKIKSLSFAPLDATLTDRAEGQSQHHLLSDGQAQLQRRTSLGKGAKNGGRRKSEEIFSPSVPPPLSLSFPVAILKSSVKHSAQD